MPLQFSPATLVRTAGLEPAPSGERAKEAGNPLESLTVPKVNRRERLLTGGEIGALMKALDAAEVDGSEHPQAIGAIKAVILTGARI